MTPTVTEAGVFREDNLATRHVAAATAAAPPVYILCLSLSLYKIVMYVYKIKNPVKWRRSPVKEAQMGIIADTEAKYHTTIYT